MSVIKGSPNRRGQSESVAVGEKVICHREYETREVWQVLYHWAGTSERRWQMLVVMALLECAEWTQEMVAMGLRLSRPRIAQVASDAKRELPRAFEPSPKDIAGAA